MTFQRGCVMNVVDRPRVPGQCAAKVCTYPFCEKIPPLSKIDFTPDTRPKCPVCGCLGVVSIERGGEDPAYTLYYCAEQRHPYYLPQGVD